MADIEKAAQIGLVPIEFWFPLEPSNYNKLRSYLAKTEGIHFQSYGERFEEYFLYNDGDPPMGKKPDYNRYRRLLEQIIDHIANDEIRSRLKPDEQGFDFGKHADGECIPIISEEPIVNVYDAAIEEAERQMYGR